MIFIRWWLERRARGKILATFVEVDGRQITQLCRRDRREMLHTINPIMGYSEAYFVESDKIAFSRWPSGLPSFLQIAVPSLLYTRGTASPIDIHSLPPGAGIMPTAGSIAIKWDGTVDEPETGIDDGPQPLRRRFDFKEAGPDG